MGKTEFKDCVIIWLWILFKVMFAVKRFLLNIWRANLLYSYRKQPKSYRLYVERRESSECWEFFSLLSKEEDYVLLYFRSIPLINKITMLKKCFVWFFFQLIVIIFINGVLDSLPTATSFTSFLDKVFNMIRKKINFGVSWAENFCKVNTLLYVIYIIC